MNEINFLLPKLHLCSVTTFSLSVIIRQLQLRIQGGGQGGHAPPPFPVKTSPMLATLFHIWRLSTCYMKIHELNDDFIWSCVTTIVFMIFINLQF